MITRGYSRVHYQFPNSCFCAIRVVSFANPWPSVLWLTLHHLDWEGVEEIPRCSGNIPDLIIEIQGSFCVLENWDPRVIRKGWFEKHPIEDHFQVVLSINPWYHWCPKVLLGWENLGWTLIHHVPCHRAWSDMRSARNVWFRGHIHLTFDDQKMNLKPDFIWLKV